MRSFLLLGALIGFAVHDAWTAPAIAATSSTSCSAAGGDDNGNGLAVTCNTDTGTKAIPFSNLVQAVNALSIFNANVSGDVNVEASNVETLTYTGNSAEIPDNAFAAFKSLRELTIDFSQASSSADGTPTTGPPVNLKPNAFKGLEWTLRRLDLIGVNLANAGGFPAAIRSLSALQSLKFEDCSLKGTLKSQDLKQLSNLRSIEIENSPDLSIADDAFSNNGDSLEKVSLNRVQLKTIPKSVSSLKNLREFQAKSSSLTALPAVFQASGSTLKVKGFLCIFRVHFSKVYLFRSYASPTMSSPTSMPAHSGACPLCQS